MINRNTILKIFLSLVFFCSLGFLTVEGSYYWEFRQVAMAAGAMPWTDGGTITYYQPTCAPSWDPLTGICKACPMCSVVGTGVGPHACAAYQEIQLKSQKGTLNVCVPLGFVYLGGGVMPKVGGYIITGGSSNIIPWIVAIGK